MEATPDPSAPRKTFYNSTRFKDGWSPMLVAKLAALTAIIEMRQHITGESKRKLWRNNDSIEQGIMRTTKVWENKIRRLQLGDREEHEEAQGMGHGPSFWRLLSKSEYHRLPTLLREMEKTLLKKLHGRQRHEDRLQMKNASAEREKAVTKGKIGRAIKSILSQQQAPYDLNTLRLST